VTHAQLGPPLPHARCGIRLRISEVYRIRTRSSPQQSVRQIGLHRNSHRLKQFRRRSKRLALLLSGHAAFNIQRVWQAFRAGYNLVRGRAIATFAARIGSDTTRYPRCQPRENWADIVDGWRDKPVLSGLDRPCRHGSWLVSRIFIASGIGTQRCQPHYPTDDCNPVGNGCRLVWNFLRGNDLVWSDSSLTWTPICTLHFAIRILQSDVQSIANCKVRIANCKMRSKLRLGRVTDRHTPACSLRESLGQAIRCSRLARGRCDRPRTCLSPAP
jgi:hypothetical protein